MTELEEKLEQWIERSMTRLKEYSKSEEEDIADMLETVLERLFDTHEGEMQVRLKKGFLYAREGMEMLRRDAMRLFFELGREYEIYQADLDDKLFGSLKLDEIFNDKENKN